MGISWDFLSNCNPARVPVFRYETTLYEWLLFKNDRGPKLSRIPNYAFSFNRREIRNLLSEASDGRSLIRRIHCLDTSEETKAFLSIDAYNPKINNTSIKIEVPNKWRKIKKVCNETKV